MGHYGRKGTSPLRVLSIEASGFFSHEPIIVAYEGAKNTVIEGIGG